MSVKIKVKLDGIEKIMRDIVNEQPQIIDDLNQEMIPKMLETMLAGASPVKGFRRYEAYKDKDKYPGTKKASRPVNLKLSGLLQYQLGAFIINKKIYIGIDPTSDEHLKTYAQANNEGTQHIARRAFIPVQQGEEFNVTLSKIIKKIFTSAIGRIITKQNRG